MTEFPNVAQESEKDKRAGLCGVSVQRPPLNIRTQVIGIALWA